jgi:3-(3-hydroxy-phenyl)propionate hydroxylase
VKRLGVIVVGAGPVGIVTALAIAAQGLDVTVLETDERYDEKPRAATTHASTLEMLRDLGLVDEVIRQGLISARFQHWDRVSRELVAEFDYGLLAGDTPYPYAVQCESHKTVAIAEAKMAQYANARVLRRHEVVEIQARGDSVRVVCNTPGGRLGFEADYLVGTDGARSLVRKSMGIGFEGYTFPEGFVGLTTLFDFEREYGYSNRNYFADPQKFVMLFKVAGNDMRGLWRVISPTDANESDATVLTEDSVQARLQHFFPRGTPYDIQYRGLYRFHQRVAERFSAGRVFLAGDAAHVNNPAGGLGMNSGIHDGIELAELFAAVASGADATILDRYDRRRRPLNVEFVQEQTVANKRRLEERDPVVRKAHLDELRRIAGDPARAREFLLRASLLESVRKARTMD